MSFRLQCKAGRIPLHMLSGTSPFSELQSIITEKTEIQPNSQKILFGYPPKEVSSYNNNSCITSLGIKKGDTIFVQELQVPRCAAISEEVRLATDDEKRTATNSDCGNNNKHNITAKPLLEHRIKLTRSVVPADNSCLFKSISILLCQETSSTELRELAAGAITSQPDLYSTAVLGRPPQDYVAWILKDDSWGGAIELALFSKLFTTELDVVDIQTKRIEKFNEGSFSSRALLIYDGIHYDPLVICDHHGNIVQSVFPVSNEFVLEAALEIATEAYKARHFTDMANFTLRCLVCNKALKGHTDAEGHAKTTGHINFGEV